MPSDSTIRVRLTVEYDMEVFDGDPDDVFVLCQDEREYLLNNGFDITLPDPDDLLVRLEPILEAGT